MQTVQWQRRETRVAIFNSHRTEASHEDWYTFWRWISKCKAGYTKLNVSFDTIAFLLSAS